MLLSFSLHPALDSVGKVTKLFTCTASNVSSTNVTQNSALKVRAHGSHFHLNSHQHFHSRQSAMSCNVGKKQSISLSMTVDSTSESASPSDIQNILQALHTQLVQLSSCNATSIFGYYNNVAAGFYAGSAIDNFRSVPSLFQNLKAQISEDQISHSMVVERCSDTPNAAYVIGLAIDTSGDLATVRKPLLRGTMEHAQEALDQRLSLMKLPSTRHLWEQLSATA